MASREVLVVGRNLGPALALASPSGVTKTIAAFISNDSQQTKGLAKKRFRCAAHWWFSSSQVYAPAPPVPR